jgi:transcriptional regulator with XRE-family HTH domain
MLLGAQTVSTGLGALDDVLGGLYWGDNVVWQFDGIPVEPFYSAIASQSAVFETKAVISLGSAVNTYGIPGVTIVDAAQSSPGDLLRDIHRLCHPRGRRLVLFESLNSMVRTWGLSATREFFARCCPMLLELGAIAYWSMSARETPASLQNTVSAVTQCVLRVDERNVHVLKAEGRDDSVRGSVLHWHDEGGHPVLSPPEIVARVAASLRAVRRARDLSQHDLGDLAGVTASAISQVERAERGLSLATVARLSGALGVTIDDLVRGEDSGGYRIGRRTDDPQRGFDRTLTLLDDTDAALHIELAHLDARETAEPGSRPPGTAVVAVASGLVQIRAARQTPALRHGEVLVADSEQIDGWRNLGQAEAVVFWIVFVGQPYQRAKRSRAADASGP